MNESFSKWLAGIVIGALIAVFVTQQFFARRLCCTPANYHPTPPRSYSLAFGVDLVAADGSPCSEPFNGIPPSTNDPVPLAADYLGNDPGYVKTLVCLDCGHANYPNCGTQRRVAQQSSYAYSVGASCTIPRRFPIVQPVNCNPEIPDSCIPGPEVI